MDVKPRPEKLGKKKNAAIKPGEMRVFNFVLNVLPLKEVVNNLTPYHINVVVGFNVIS